MQIFLQDAKEKFNLKGKSLLIRFCLKILILVLAGNFFYAYPAGSTVAKRSSKHLSIIYSNDLYGELENCGCDEQQLGGLTRKATLIKKWKEKYGKILLLDAGNIFFAKRPLNEIEKKQSLLKSHYILKTYEFMGYDAINIGEADLFLGLKSVLKLNKESSLPFLSANMVDRESGKLIFKPYIIKKIADIKIGVLGLFSDQSSVGTPSVTVKDPVSAAKEIIHEIHNQCDMIIVLSNLGIDKDRKLACTIPEIDIIFGSRSETLLLSPIREGKTLIVNAYNRGQYLGRMDVAYRQTSERLFFEMHNHIIPLQEDIEDDPFIANIAKEYKTKVIAINRQEFFKEKLSFKKANQKETVKYTGVGKCAVCHQPQYEKWENSAHAHAYGTLKNEGNNFDIECLPCHTTGYEEPGGYHVRQGESSEFLNVQCESCHGPGSSHKRKGDIIRDGGLAVCLECHDEKTSPNFNYEEYLPIVKCPTDHDTEIKKD